MGSTDPLHLLLFAAGVLVLTSTTVALQRAAGVRLGWLPVVAIVRAGAQLGIIALILRGVLSAPWTVLAFLLLMVGTASWTSSGRLRELHRGRTAAVAGVAAGAVTTLVLVAALRLVPFEVRSLVAVAGIVIGNTMTAATLSGRGFLNLAIARRDQVEGWFALGARPLQAYAGIARDALREALLPNLDQTRATGLVTLPGAFVGALIGGASPLAAAQFQLVVLAGIGLAMTVTGLVVTRLAGGSPYVVLSAEERADTTR